jgi:hypothetical protein
LERLFFAGASEKASANDVTTAPFHSTQFMLLYERLLGFGSGLD